MLPMYFEEGSGEKEVRSKITIDAVSKWVNTKGKYISRFVSFEAWVLDAVSTEKPQNPSW